MLVTVQRKELVTAELICDPGISGFSFSATQATCSKGWARH